MKDTDLLRRAWARFQETMESCRLAAESTPRFAESAINRAAIYRSLAQVQAMAYNFAVAPSVEHPRILVNMTYQTNMYTLGLACQDFFYGAAYLDGRRRYRLHGCLGKIAWAAVQVQSGIMGTPQSRNLGDFKLADFADEEGRFDIIVGADKSCGIPLAEESPYNFLWIRRILSDWTDDHGELMIEPLDPSAGELADEAALAARIDIAANFAGFLVKNWAIALYDNFLALAGGHNLGAWLGGAAVSDEDVGSPQAYYGAFVYKLQPDEVLLLEGRLPDAPYWGIQLGDVWSNSLDFLNHQADLNMDRVAVDGQGNFQAVIARDDPGIANWLDCCGQDEGVGMVRVFDAREQPDLPSFKVVKRDTLSGFLSPETRLVTPEERKEALTHRRISQIRLYGE